MIKPIVTTLTLISLTVSLFADSKLTANCNPLCKPNHHACSPPTPQPPSTPPVQPPVLPPVCPPTPPPQPPPGNLACFSIETADFVFAANHTYRVYASVSGGRWQHYGTIRATESGPARVWFPAASTRPILWQVVDATPGYPPCGITKYEPNCLTKTQYVILGRGNVRPVK